jgi:hypothetical protein
MREGEGGWREGGEGGEGEVHAWRLNMYRCIFYRALSEKIPADPWIARELKSRKRRASQSRVPSHGGLPRLHNIVIQLH